MTWRQLHPDMEPLDQGFDDIRGTADESFWGEIGPDGRPGKRWSWTIIGTNDAGDQWEVDGGFAQSEAEAKAAVESWAADRA